VLVEQVRRTQRDREIAAKPEVGRAHLVPTLGQRRHGERAELAGRTGDQDTHQPGE
jgi:hypothetical protein